MSSPRITKLFEALAYNLRGTGYPNITSTTGMSPVIRWLGRDAQGRDAVLIDLDSATWASGNRRCIVYSTPAGTKPTDFADFHTQSHAQGHTIDGSVALTLCMEALGGTDTTSGLAAQTGAQAKFQHDMLHILRGQLGAPIDLQLCAAGSEPTVNGVNGASADAVYTDAGEFLPWGLAIPGGV